MNGKPKAMHYGDHFTRCGLKPVTAPWCPRSMDISLLTCKRCRRLLDQDHRREVVRDANRAVAAAIGVEPAPAAAPCHHESADRIEGGARGAKYCDACGECVAWDEEAGRYVEADEYPPDGAEGVSDRGRL